MSYIGETQTVLNLGHLQSQITKLDNFISEIENGVNNIQTITETKQIANNEIVDIIQNNTQTNTSFNNQLDTYNNRSGMIDKVYSYFDATIHTLDLSSPFDGFENIYTINPPAKQNSLNQYLIHCNFQVDCVSPTDNQELFFKIIQDGTFNASYIHKIQIPFNNNNQFKTVVHMTWTTNHNDVAPYSLTYEHSYSSGSVVVSNITMAFLELSN